MPVRKRLRDSGIFVREDGTMGCFGVAVFMFAILAGSAYCMTQ